MTECWDSVTKDCQCCANASVGNHPAGITSRRAPMLFSTDADETDQFCPPQVSFGAPLKDDPDSLDSAGWNRHGHFVSTRFSNVFVGTGRNRCLESRDLLRGCARCFGWRWSLRRGRRCQYRRQIQRRGGRVSRACGQDAHAANSSMSPTRILSLKLYSHPLGALANTVDFGSGQQRRISPVYAARHDIKPGTRATNSGCSRYAKASCTLVGRKRIDR